LESRRDYDQVALTHATATLEPISAGQRYDIGLGFFGIRAHPKSRRLSPPPAHARNTRCEFRMKSRSPSRIEGEFPAGLGIYDFEFKTGWKLR
jgi:hypothetical protein